MQLTIPSVDDQKLMNDGLKYRMGPRYYPARWVVVMLFKWSIVAMGIIAASTYLSERMANDRDIARIQSLDDSAKVQNGFRLDSMRAVWQEAYAEKRRREFEKKKPKPPRRVPGLKEKKG